MKKILLVAAGFIFVVSLVAAGQAPSPAMQMALDNMSKVMVDMDEGQRMQYMMEKQREGIEHGQGLFNNRSLGTNNRSCNSCHPDGTTTNTSTQIPMPLSNGMQPSMPIPTLVGAGATFPKYKVPNDSVITLAVMNNNCLQMFMMGQPLDLASEDSRDLAAFVASLSNGEEVKIGN